MREINVLFKDGSFGNYIGSISRKGNLITIEEAKQTIWLNFDAIFSITIYDKEL